jgi:DNA/RNA endonuclease G (NUC1)
LGITGSRAQGTPAVFINEIHYDNVGVDSGEFIEIAGPAGTNLTGYSIVLYNGNGGAVYDTDALSGTIPNQQNGFGTVSLSYPSNGIQNGQPDGVALVNNGVLVQFLSYEGSFVAVGGPANGQTATNIGVSENPDNSVAVGNSLRLIGTGSGYSDFTWAGPAPNSAGLVNQGQTFTGGGSDTAPSVTATTPADGATGVDPNANIVINFSEPVTATTSAFTIECGAPVAFGQTSGAASSFVLDPNVALPAATTCIVMVTAAEVSDLDANDPPDHPAENRSFSFMTAVPPPATVFINEVDADTPGNGFDLAEFVEIYDGGVGNTSLNGLTVVFYNGTDDKSYAAFDLDGYTTNASGYFTLGNPGVAGVDITFEPGDFGFLQNGADAVAVVAGNATSYPNGTPVSTGNVIDAVVYDTDDADDPQLLALLNAGQPQVNENASGDGPNQSSGRCANGTGGLRNTSTYRAGAPSPDGPNNCPAPSNSLIVISQFYGSGGNDDAIYQNDYVELYNRGDVAVDVTGWSLQYAAAAGTSWANKVPLGGPIGPGQYYLVKLATNDATVGAPLPAPNVTGLINMSGSNGKIALVNAFDSMLGDCPLSNPHLMDLVGYGVASCGEGNTRAPALSAFTADVRLGGGATDTNNNFADFVAGAPTPRRTAPIVELGPFLLASDPAPNGTNVPRDPTLVFTFSEPVTVVGHWFDLNCATTGVHDSYSLTSSGSFVDVTLNVDLLAGEVCNITVFKDQVHDQDGDDSAAGTDTLPGNYSWSFTVATGAPPPYPSSVHLTFGNPTNADLASPENYLMEKAEYALSYNRDLGRPNWVSWHLSPEWYGTLTRVDTFRADPRIPDDPDWYRVQGFDFSGSGFDRGHMVPNADRDNQNRIPVNQATYLMTNMVAQAPGNNQGPWAALEGALRTLADAGNDLFIVAGPHGEGGYGSSLPRTLTNKIANGKVSVPAETWKAVIVWPRPTGTDPRDPISCATRTIAVIMPNDDAVVRTDDGKLKTDWENYLTSIDEVEALTGYDLFAELPDAVEYCVEAGINGNNPPADINPPVVDCAAADSSWHGDNVAITCTASDSESGLGNPADASFTLMTSVALGDDNANASTGSRIVCDVLGNCATAGPIAGNMIDRKNPVITLTTPSNGAVYQLNHAVIAVFACGDNGSGVATCVGTAANGAAVDTSSTGARSFVVTATDVAGNTSSTTVSYIVDSGAISISNIPSPASIGDSFVPGFDYAGDGATSVTSSTPSVCAVSGNVVTFLKLGTCTLVAHAAGTATFDPATGPAQSFEITKRVTTISIANIPADAVSGGSFTPVFDYAGNGQTHLRSETPSVCKIHGDSSVRFVGSGICSVSAWATPSGTYQRADGPLQSFVVQ